jgi:hypothetical protein
MHNNLQDNQSFIDDAKSRGLDTLAYQDPKSQEFMLLAGHPESVRLLGEILDDYEMVYAVVAAIDTDLLERWRREASRSQEHSEGCGPLAEHDARINPEKPGEHKHAQ